MAGRSVSPPGLRSRGGRVTSLGALAFGALSLFLLSAGSSSAALTPRLVVSSVETATSQMLTISASKAMTDDAVGRVQFYVPNGYLLNSPAGGVSVGTASAQAVLHDVDPSHDQGLRGTVIAIGPGDGSVAWEAANCDGNTHLAAWMVQLTGAKGVSLSFPVFVDGPSAFGPYVLNACFRPADIPAGSANRSALGAVVDSFTLSLTPFQRPTTAGDYRWRSVWTPFTAGTGTLDSIRNVEAQSIVTIPTGQIVIYGKKTTGKVKGKSVVRVEISGQVLVGGEPVGPVIVTIRHGSSRARLRSLGTAKAGSDGGYTKFATITAPRQYFQASAHVPAKDLGASGCQASFPGVPCVDATTGAGRAISGTMLVKR
jgi:hypothetical protein